MNRRFKYADDSYKSLKHKNTAHGFAMNHALRIYSANAVYSFIPKNACTTMRVSLAIANGCIRDEHDFNWVHQNNDTFTADLASALTAAYTFVILRCPFARLASCYLDKIVGHYPDAWQLYELTNRQKEVSDMSFAFFIRQMQKKTIRDANIHWRPQVDFLVYEKYDDYFCLENFAQVPEMLKAKINLPIVDARQLTKHGIGGFTLLGEPGQFAGHSAFHIMQLKRAGKCPNPASLYTEELVAIVKKHYAEDISLYQSLFGDEHLMFV
ncbi:hypothetical protein JCM14076_25920 [Methylosoma difficile]